MGSGWIGSHPCNTTGLQLDWTQSLFAAVYFAVEKNWQDDGELWLCDVDSLRNAAAKALAFENPDKSSYDDFDEANGLHAKIKASPLVQTLESNEDQRPSNLDWERWLTSIPMTGSSLQSVMHVLCGMRQIHVDIMVGDHENLQSIVFPMTLRIVTDRIHAQQGWFTVPLDPRIDHQSADVLAGDSIKRMVIPANQKPDFLRKLKTANVAGHSLFPGLDGLGKSVGEQIRLDLL